VCREVVGLRERSKPVASSKGFSSVLTGLTATGYEGSGDLRCKAVPKVVSTNEGAVDGHREGGFAAFPKKKQGPRCFSL
jgi:hypothetical protein